MAVTATPPYIPPVEHPVPIPKNQEKEDKKTISWEDAAKLNIKNEVRKSIGNIEQQNSPKEYIEKLLIQKLKEQIGKYPSERYSVYLTFKINQLKEITNISYRLSVTAYASDRPNEAEDVNKQDKKIDKIIKKILKNLLGTPIPFETKESNLKKIYVKVQI